MKLQSVGNEYTIFSNMMHLFFSTRDPLTVHKLSLGKLSKSFCLWEILFPTSFASVSKRLEKYSDNFSDAYATHFVSHAKIFKVGLFFFFFTYIWNLLFYFLILLLFLFFAGGCSCSWGGFFFFFLFTFISWRLITLQYCNGFCHILTWICHGFTCVPHPNPPLLPPSPSHPSGSSQCTRPEHLSHASNLDWQSVSHLIIYMFQCYSCRSPHTCLLP